MYIPGYLSNLYLYILHTSLNGEDLLNAKKMLPCNPGVSRKMLAWGHTSPDPGPGPDNKCFERGEISPPGVGVDRSGPISSGSLINPSALKFVFQHSWEHPWRTLPKSLPAAAHGPPLGRDAWVGHQSAPGPGSPLQPRGNKNNPVAIRLSLINLQ